MRGLFLLLVSSLLLFGCLGGGSRFDPLLVAKSSGVIGDFLKEHPSAMAKVVYLEAKDFKPLAEVFSKECEKEIEVKPYYKVTLVDEGISAVALVSEDGSKVICAQVSSKKAVAAPIATVASGQILPTTVPTAEATPEPTRAPVQAEGFELVEFKDEKNGYSILKPVDWESGIKDDRYLEVVKGNSDVIIWPIKLGGEFLKYNAVDMANYIVGKIKENLPDFELLEASKSDGNDKMNIVASYSVDRVKYKGSFLSVGDNKGNILVIGYEAPFGEFASKEALLRKIAASYNPLVNVGKSASQTLSLEDWSDGDVSWKIPSGWSSFGGSSCTTKFVQAFDPKNTARRVFIYGGLGPVYFDASAKQRDIQYCESLRAIYGPSHPCTLVPGTAPTFDAPLAAGVTKEAFLEAVPGIFQMQMIRQFAPNLEPFGMDVVGLEIASDGQEIFTVNFDFNGVPAVGKMTMGPLLPSEVTGYMYGYGIVGITAEDNAGLAEVYPTALKTVESLTLSQSFISSCQELQNTQAKAYAQVSKTLSETSDIITGGYTARQQPKDVMSEKWSDAILGYERYYDSDKDEVYKVPLQYADAIETHGGMTKLTPSQYTDYVPLTLNVG